MQSTMKVNSTKSGNLQRMFRNISDTKGAVITEFIAEQDIAALLSEEAAWKV